MFLLAKYFYQLKDLQSLANLTDVRFFSPFHFFTENITIVSPSELDLQTHDFKIALYAKETQRYLCFNDKWRLVGMVSLVFKYNLLSLANLTKKLETNINKLNKWNTLVLPDCFKLQTIL